MDKLLSKKETKLIKKLYNQMPDLGGNCPKDHFGEFAIQEIPSCKMQCCNDQIVLTFVEFAYAFDHLRELLKGHPGVLNNFLQGTNSPYCLFFSEGSKCLIYEARPYSCRAFHRPNLLNATKCEVKQQKEIAKRILRINKHLKSQAETVVDLVNQKTNEKIGTKNMILSYTAPQFQATFEGWLGILDKILDSTNNGTQTN